MKKFIRTIISIAMVVVLALGMVACSDPADNEGEKGLVLTKYRGEDFYTVYSYVDDGETSSLDLTDTAVVGNKVIGRIAPNAFANNASLTEIILPTTVTEIGAGAFKGMKKLNSLTLPFIGKYVKADAFMDETGTDDNDVKAIDTERTIAHLFGLDEYEEGVETTVNYTPSSTTSCYIPATLNTIKIAPASDYKIPMHAFHGVKVLRKVVLTEKVVGIGSYAFAECSNLGDILIPASVANIYNNAFQGCAKIDISFAPNSALTKIEDYVFYKSGIKHLDFLPEGILSIGEFAFSESSLRTVNLPSTIKELKYGAFAKCEDLDTVLTTATSVKTADYAFYNCSSLDVFDAITQKGIDTSIFSNPNAYINTLID